MYVAMALGAIGGVVSAIGAVQQGNAAAAAANYNAQINDSNAARLRAEGESEAQDKRREMRRQLGVIRASYGASGIDFSGSPLDVLADAATEYSLDIKKIRYRAEVGAIDQQNEATLNRFTAKSAKTAGYIGAGSALLSGASSSLNSYAQFGSFGAGNA